MLSHYCDYTLISDELDELMGRLLGALDQLVTNRRGITTGHDQFSKALSMLASCEENTGLARTLSKLSETHESMAMIGKHVTQEDSSILLETFQVKYYFLINLPHFFS